MLPGIAIGMSGQRCEYMEWGSTFVGADSLSFQGPIFCAFENFRMHKSRPLAPVSPSSLRQRGGRRREMEMVQGRATSGQYLPLWQECCHLMVAVPIYGYFAEQLWNFALKRLLQSFTIHIVCSETVKGSLEASERGSGLRGGERRGRGKKLRKVHHLLLSRPNKIAYQRASERARPYRRRWNKGERAEEIKCAQAPQRLDGEGDWLLAAASAGSA